MALNKLIAIDPHPMIPPAGVFRDMTQQPTAITKPTVTIVTNSSSFLCSEHFLVVGEDFVTFELHLSGNNSKYTLNPFFGPRFKYQQLVTEKGRTRVKRDQLPPRVCYHQVSTDEENKQALALHEHLLYASAPISCATILLCSDVLQSTVSAIRRVTVHGPVVRRAIDLSCRTLVISTSPTAARRLVLCPLTSFQVKI
ncbi:hypothetical protein PoB_004101000 [Plakobranchus ocellatus]|uniref:Uncharacterized protein n=1 Tax=Plakobranchus ocellatus TaxID=259542 RepID=A0AAV4B625_9GAST|nr:hypothetical protein PoB_004101000 [Plakobranchus ocellatus]